MRASREYLPHWRPWGRSPPRRLLLPAWQIAARRGRPAASPPEQAPAPTGAMHHTQGKAAV